MLNCRSSSRTVGLGASTPSFCHPLIRRSEVFDSTVDLPHDILRIIANSYAPKALESRHPLRLARLRLMCRQWSCDRLRDTSAVFPIRHEKMFVKHCRVGTVYTACAIQCIEMQRA